jgi:GntR family transcriptional regulator, gluconate operon transcriptional repressor
LSDGNFAVDTFDPGLAPRQALWESIVAALRRAIILCELRPGLHLEEPALAEKFGVSRIPVREALTRLSHEGLVRLEPRRGAFVVGVTESEIHDIYEMRRLIEGHAIRSATENASAPGLAQLRAEADEFREAVENNAVERYAEPDVRFHRQIVVLGGNRRLVAAWDPIGGLVATFLSITNSRYRNLPGSAASHFRMIDMIGDRDADSAAAELQAHLANGESIMRQAMREIYASADLLPSRGLK